MLKNTVTGSVLAKLFPTMSKHFLENASQDDVTKAEQEAAVIHQQLQAGTESGGAEAGKIEAGAGTTEPVVSAADLTKAQADLVAMTTRATAAEAKVTTAEASVTDLTTQLAAAKAETSQYKAWYEKQVGKGKTLPGADAGTRGQVTGENDGLSAATASALETFRKRNAGK